MDNSRLNFDITDKTILLRLFLKYSPERKLTSVVKKKKEEDNFNDIILIPLFLKKKRKEPVIDGKM